MIKKIIAMILSVASLTSLPLNCLTSSAEYIAAGYIDIETLPDKTDYIVGEALDLTGLTVNLTSEGGTELYSGISPIDEEYSNLFTIEIYSSDYSNYAIYNPDEGYIFTATDSYSISLTCDSLNTSTAPLPNP